MKQPVHAPRGITFTTLNSSDVAELLHVTVGTLANWRASRRGPTWARTGDRSGRVIYRYDDVQAWLAERAEGGVAR